MAIPLITCGFWLVLWVLADGAEDGVNEVGDDAVGHDLFADIALFVVGGQGFEAGGWVWVLAYGQVEADLIVLFVFAGADLVGSGARFERDPGL